MSSDSLLNIINETPGLNMREDLARVFKEIGAEANKNVPLPRLVELAQKLAPGVSVEELVLALAEIVKHGFVQRVVRVESPLGGGIGDYDSILDVPDDIYDERQGREIHVQPENLVVIYKFAKR